MSPTQILESKVLEVLHKVGCGIPSHDIEAWRRLKKKKKDRIFVKFSWRKDYDQVM